jgi:hypothetical protein
MGYGQPHAEAGYSFSYTKPPTVIGPPNVNPVIANSTTGLVGLDHSTGMTMLASPSEGPAMIQGTVSSVSSARPRTALLGPALAAPAMVAPNPCNLADVCDRLERLERQRQAQPVPQRMPPGQPE